MIKNIIFDLGNVLINWKPAEFLENAGYNDPLKSLIVNYIFNGPEWRQLDNGDITLNEAINKIAKKSSLSGSEIKAVFDLRTKIITPIIPNIKLLPELKKRGYKLYYLSNFPDDIFDEVCNSYDFFNYFDGGEISARLQASKPDERIYRLFLQKYFLKPGDCLFIDDMSINANSAENIGMTAIHLKEPLELKSKLENALGIILNV
ncbi:MAG TPA: HAD family phosphatase [Bacteroidales bacterium]|nr:HAD family phosphatase [Bacteroidales bacterium]HCI54634.1 HAD family phosphatase [Bacteroidales bacterium]HOU96069.1 HAD family phosphatase [Bacteroidales bacterium]HQG36970.1 HAD family phosphatase [Bacteroidales bacterium]HQG52206.1 HAD family phosphatase [Bacteroidales bacterium]